MARKTSAEVLERQARAIQLHAAGESYDSIAEALGFANRSGSWKSINNGLRAQRDLRADEYLQLQINRYERILAAWWDRATTLHDGKAANIILRTLERLDRVFRLDKGEHAVSQESVVISADPEAYARQLQQVVEEREHQARAGR